MNDAISRPSLQRMTERERGQQAWNSIEQLQNRPTQLKREYRTYARQLASLIRTNGLAQTLAFLYAKAKPKQDDHAADPATQAEAKAAELVLTDVSKVIQAFFKDNTQLTSATAKDVLSYLLNQPSSIHRQATVEVLAFARWLSRFAEAELPSGDESSDNLTQTQEGNHASTSPS